MPDNPYSLEIRYSLDLIVYRLAGMRFHSVRIASCSPEVVKAMVRRLYPGEMEIIVENSEIQEMIRNSLGIETEIFEQGFRTADVALFPFSLENGFEPAGEQVIVAACHNALSYKSLINPRSSTRSVFQDLAKLRAKYSITPIAGLFSPHFILRWTAAKVVEQFDSALYFRLEERAMRQFVEFGPLWRLSYVVIVNGRAEQ